jgi:transposase
MNHGRIEISNVKRFIGLDLHTDKFNTCESGENSSTKIENQYLINRTDLDRFINSLDKNTYVLLESCANAFRIADMIRPHVAEVIVGDSHKMKNISLSRKKTDKIDAEKLSIMLKIQIIAGEQLINSVHVPDTAIQELRSLFTTYDQFKRNIVEVKNHIRSLCHQNLIVLPPGGLATRMIAHILALELSSTLHFQLNLHIEELLGLEEKQARIEEKIKILGSMYYKEIEILTSIKGISIITALALIADIADIHRFSTAKKLCSYLRSAPVVESSNEVTIIKRTNKFSRKLSMSFLSQGITHFKSGNPELKRWYEFKAQNAKKGKIRMAACRKIIVTIYYMLLKEQYHFYRDEKKHIAKMRQYDFLLKKAGLFYEDSKIA